MKRAIVYFVWGENHLAEAIRSAISTTGLGVPRCLITDASTTPPPNAPFEEVIRIPEPVASIEAKSTLFDHLPKTYDSFLFLDSDTTVLGDVTLGFAKAERWGIAAAMAPHYSLDAFWAFGGMMKLMSVPRLGQMQFNTGVLFFTRRPDVERVFRLWRQLVQTHGPDYNRRTDQPYFTLALEMTDFNPYTLSPAFNYRNAGEGASGLIRIWHSHIPAPPDVNDGAGQWPPRRFLRSSRAKLGT